MKKVIIIGCPGAGKSYFAKKLRSVTGIPLYHPDMIWHKPDKTHIGRPEFDERLFSIQIIQILGVIFGDCRKYILSRSPETA